MSRTPRFQSSAPARGTFRPSAFSHRNPYGEGEAPVDPAAPAEEEAESEGIEKYIGIARAALGLGDPSKDLVILKSRLRTLQAGGTKAQALAWQIGTMGKVSEAIARIQGQIAVAEEQASLSQTRDTMYTALAVAGVALVGMAGLFVGVKVLGGVRQTQIQAEELKHLRSQA